MKKLIAFLNRLSPISASFEAELTHLLHFVKLEQYKFLLTEGEVCRYIWYLQKGRVRCFYRYDGNEITLWTMSADHVIVPVKNLFRQIRSKYFLQALEYSELYRIRIDDILHLLNTYPEVLSIETAITRQYSNLQSIHTGAVSLIREQARLERIKEYIHNNLAADLSATAVAGKFSLSVSTLLHVFKEHEQETFQQYVSNIRMGKAYDIISKGGRIKEAMFATGYKYRGTFNSTFKRKFGHPPSHFTK